MHRDRQDRRGHGARVAALILFGTLGGASCAVDLSESVEGRPCTPDGQCLAGYVCSDDGICVRKSTLSSGGQQNRNDAGAGGASGGVSRGGTGGDTDSGGVAGATQAGGAPGAGGTFTIEPDAGSGGAIVVRDGSADVDASVVVPTEAGPESGLLDAAPDAALAEASVPDSGAPPAGVLCRDALCTGGQYCCVSSYSAGTAPPATAFSCAAGTGTCPYTLRCDSDADCASGELCCSRLSNGSWVAACATSCPAAGIHLGCSGPDQCPGQICCGTYSVPLNHYASTSCRATCNGALDRTFCASAQDCSATGQQCSESSYLPGFRTCQ